MTDKNSKWSVNQGRLNEEKGQAAVCQGYDQFLDTSHFTRANESDSFVTASMRQIKKDFVKEQRKRFETGPKAVSIDIPTNPVPSAPRVSAFIQTSNLRKSKSSLALNRDQKLSDINDRLDSVPLATSVPSSKSFNQNSGKSSVSSVTGNRVSKFEQHRKDNDSISTLSKPNIRPKPEHLSSPRPSLKSSDSKKFIFSNRDTYNGQQHPSVLQNPKPEMQDKNDGLDTKVNRNKPVLCSPPTTAAEKCSLADPIGLKSKTDFLPFAPTDAKLVKGKESLDQPGIRYHGSPDVDKILSRTEGKRLADEEKWSANERDCAAVATGKAIETETNENNKVTEIVTKFDSNQPASVDAIRPPPKPPRIFLELKQSPTPKPRKEHIEREGIHELQKETTSVDRMSERSAELKEVSPLKSSSAFNQSVPPVNKELSKPAPKKLPVERNKLDQWWENKFIRAPPVAAHRSKENVRLKRLNNPCYMYAKVSQPDDIIGVRPLVRHLSDERIDSSSVLSNRIGLTKSHYNDAPIYHDPCDVLKEKRKVVESVLFDKDGYALPMMSQNVASKKTGLYSSETMRSNAATAVQQEERSYVKSKVSNAYSILRLPMFPGDQSHAGRDEDGEIDLEEHRKLLRHVSNVKYRMKDAVTNYETVRLASTDRLFQYAMIIELQQDVSGDVRPKVKFCFPVEMTESETLTSRFCFPDANNLKPQNTYEEETFSFILTSSTGDRRYGLCKRYLPPGSQPRFPEAMCIVSRIGNPEFYGDLLEAAKRSRNLALDYAEEVLKLAYGKPFPEPNHEVYLSVMGPNLKKRPLILKRSPDSRLHTVEFSLLFRHLTVNSVLKVFGAILLERKIIFFAKSLSTLSSCICAFVALLYPFEWQHTFVTVLPSDLTDIIDAPTPYILGLLSSTVSDIDEITEHLNEVLIVDLDCGSLTGVGDEGCIIPKKLQKALTIALSDDPDSQNNAIGPNGRGVQNATVAEAFLRMFLETCGHYTEYICSQQDGEIIFQRELFVKAVHSRSIRLFLEWFTQTQMFAAFVTSRLKESPDSGYFEQRILEYRQEMEETSSTFESMKAVGRKIADFLRGSGDKIKRTFQKAVYI